MEVRVLLWRSEEDVMTVIIVTCVDDDVVVYLLRLDRRQNGRGVVMKVYEIKERLRKVEKNRKIRKGSKEANKIADG